MQFRIAGLFEQFPCIDHVIICTPRLVHCGITAAVTSASKTTRQASGPARFIRHYTATHQIDVHTPTEANGRCYYAVLTHTGLDHWGRYVDRYVCQQGRWLFSERKISVDGAVAGGWGEQAAQRAQRSPARGGPH